MYISKYNAFTSRVSCRISLLASMKISELILVLVPAALPTRSHRVQLPKRLHVTVPNRNNDSNSKQRAPADRQSFATRSKSEWRMVERCLGREKRPNRARNQWKASPTTRFHPQTTTSLPSRPLQYILTHWLQPQVLQGPHGNFIWKQTECIGKKGGATFSTGVANTHGALQTELRIVAVTYSSSGVTGEWAISWSWTSSGACDRSDNLTEPITWPDRLQKLYFLLTFYKLQIPAPIQLQFSSTIVASEMGQ